jgi:hypothetical protein
VVEEVELAQRRTQGGAINPNNGHGKRKYCQRTNIGRCWGAPKTECCRGGLTLQKKRCQPGISLPKFVPSKLARELFKMAQFPMNE